jgi:hypothetical protein
MALGPYDVTRNETVFDIQMQYFFGFDWRDKIDYNVRHFDESDPFIVYKVKETNTTVFGFRGFASGAETALHAQHVLLEFIVPTLTDLVPFYEIVVDLFMEDLMAVAMKLASSFPAPQMLHSAFLNKAIKVYEEEGTEQTIFMGINVGGLFAKTLGLLYETYGISFVSFPVLDDVMKVLFEVHDMEDQGQYVTNFHTVKGWFTSPEPGFGNNHAIPWIPLGISSDLVEVAETLQRLKPTGAIRDSVYRTFCILEELCGRQKQFGEYCSQVIGEDDTLYIRMALEAEEEESE